MKFGLITIQKNSPSGVATDVEVVVDLVVGTLVVVERTVDGTLVVVEGIVEGSLVLVVVDLSVVEVVVVEVVVVEGVVEVVLVEIVVEGIVNATVEVRVDPADVVEEVVVDKRMSRPCLSTPWSYHLQRIRPSSGETGLIPSVFGTIVSPCSLLL